MEGGKEEVYSHTCTCTHAHTTKGKIPMGFRFTAKNASETTHEIPIEGFELAERDYRQILSELERFLCPDGAQLPPVFAKVRPHQSCDVTSDKSRPRLSLATICVGLT